MEYLRQAIESQVRKLFASDGGATETAFLEGDVGLFGPDSASWKVHGDLTTMMVGGVAALLLQMLHPAALAGVWDHSNFREDRLGRLRRTARFIARTTYGSTEEAMGAVAQVRAIHARVSGTTQEGAAYAADDPDLLTWVHVAEVTCFLKAYMRYKAPGFSVAEQERYVAETALIPRLLGAGEVPQTRTAIEIYLQDVRPVLRCDARTREVAHTLLTEPSRKPDARLAAELIFRAAQDLLPGWAARMHGFETSLAGRGAVNAGIQGLGATLRWAMRNSAEIRARRRAAGLATGSAQP